MGSANRRPDRLLEPKHFALHDNLSLAGPTEDAIVAFSTSRPTPCCTLEPYEREIAEMPPLQSGRPQGREPTAALSTGIASQRSRQWSGHRLALQVRPSVYTNLAAGQRDRRENHLCSRLRSEVKIAVLAVAIALPADWPGGTPA
jgi:hypothetical protein